MILYHIMRSEDRKIKNIHVNQNVLFEFWTVLVNSGVLRIESFGLYGF